MRKTAIFVWTLLFAAMPAMLRALAPPQTIDGVVSDSMCGKTHMMPGKTAAECTKECVKDGASYVLVAGDKTFPLVGKKAAIASFAGKHVRVQGELQNKILTVTTINQTTADAMPSGMKM